MMEVSNISSRALFISTVNITSAKKTLISIAITVDCCLNTGHVLVTNIPVVDIVLAHIGK